jgi:hypothetical protein
MIQRHFAPVLSLKAFSVKVSFRKLHATKPSAIFIITRREFSHRCKNPFPLVAALPRNKGKSRWPL